MKFLICTCIGDAAYVGANYRTFLPFFILGGMLFAVLVIYVILFRKLKPYHSVEHKYTNRKAKDDVVELVTEQEAEATETEATETEVTSL